MVYDDAGQPDRLVGLNIDITERKQVEQQLAQVRELYRWFAIRAVPLRDDAGRVMKWVGTSTDIHEVRIARDSLRLAHDDLERRVQERTAQLTAANAELGRSNAELRQFAYVASHDLQEPLRTMTSFTQLLRRHLQASPEHEVTLYMNFIVEAAARMKDLIDDLLVYARIGANPVALRAVDSAEVVRVVHHNLQAAVAEADAIIQTDALPVVLGDRQQLMQVFQNLISNSIKFRRDGEQPRVVISAQLTGEFWQFSVADNGIGIDPQYHAKVFQIFQRLHTRARYPGSGIGLSICRRIVERCGGQIWFESAPGLGTTFYFTLPDVNSSRLSLLAIPAETSEAETTARVPTLP